MKIVVLDGYVLNPGDLSWDGIKKLGDCTIYDRTSPELTIERAKDAEVAITNKVVFDKNIINRLPKFKYIGVLATGYNVIDVEAAKNNGIVVTNIPAYSTASVAQMVFSHILNFAQNVSVHALRFGPENGQTTLILPIGKHRKPSWPVKHLELLGLDKLGKRWQKLVWHWEWK